MKVMPSVSKENTVLYPDHVSEFEVQAELFFSLKRNFPSAEFRGEVKSRGTHGLRKEKTACRFDIVAYESGVAACIIEVKDRDVKHKTNFEDTRQGIRYRTYGIPVIVCYGVEDIQESVSAVGEALGGS